MSEISSDPSTIRAEIAQTRAELGDTVEALAAKVDVKARMEGAARDARQRVRDMADLYGARAATAKDRVVTAIGPRWPVVMAASLAALAAALGLQMWRRRQ